MADSIEQVAHNFWSIRGTFRIFGVLNIGTHAALVRRASGRYALLDSYTLKGEVANKVLELTEGGDELDAIINLHPFHTVHVEALAAQFPNAWLYGTSRHHALFPKLAWQPHRVETDKFAALFAEDFEFSVPAGVAFVAKNPNHHFSSVLAYHRVSRTLHVDDTLNWIPIPWSKRLAFHPTLKSVLEERPGAAADFRTWARALVARSHEVENICTAHASASDLLGQPAGVIASQIQAALETVEPVLQAHERRFG